MEVFSSLPPLSLCGMSQNGGCSSRSLRETCWTMLSLCVCNGMIWNVVGDPGESLQVLTVIPLSNIRTFSQDLTCPVLCCVVV